VRAVQHPPGCANLVCVPNLETRTGDDASEPLLLLGVPFVKHSRFMRMLSGWHAPAANFCRFHPIDGVSSSAGVVGETVEPCSRCRGPIRPGYAFLDIRQETCPVALHQPVAVQTRGGAIYLLPRAQWIGSPGSVRRPVRSA